MKRLFAHLSRISAFCGFAIVVLQPNIGLTQAVLTQHNDLGRSGANPHETILTTSNVNQYSFGKIMYYQLDGFTYAQPLYDPGVNISSGTHNVVYVATAHNSVYAFDADNGEQFWKVSLGTSVPSSVINTPNIQVEVGIISTPVIDPSTGTLYAVAKTYENNVQIFRLHALDITTGAEKFGGPVQISASIAGTGMQSSGGQVPFVASQENQRAALTLVNGTVYLAFASHEDYTPYHGWILGYSASTLHQQYVYNVTPNSGQGAIWMGGQGLVADANYLYLITGNSTQSTENNSADYGESFLKLQPSGNTLNPVDYFKPKNYDTLNANDTDLGSAGAFLIPGTSYIAGGSKSGMVYVVNTTSMGKLNTSADQVVQEWQADDGLWGSPAFFNNTMYIWGCNQPMYAYQFSGGKFNTRQTSQTSYVTPGGETCGSVSVSSNGTNAGTGIVWATAPTGDPDHATVGGNMYAYDATNLGTLLWSTGQNPGRDGYGNYAKFDAPTIANGKVYVGTDSGIVAVYGLLAAPATLIPNGTYVLTNVNSGMALEDPGFSKTNSTYMEQYTVNNGSNQQWKVTNLGDNVITLTNGASTQLLDVYGGSYTAGALLDQYPASGGVNQQFRVVSAGNGHYALISIGSNLAVEVYQASKTNKASIDQWYFQNNSNQLWNFQAP